ncbi:MAG: decarboxylase [Candidatus Aenigmarchaeota archaeon]|nr:decarboxylase [Candidatus Aenigmarchaeota archaeon]
MSNSKFVVNRSKIIEQFQKLKQLDLDVSYSVKTFPEICPILENNTDSFFSVHMPQSLRFVKDMSRVWFLTQTLDENLLDGLTKKGLGNFIVDNETDLKILEKYIQKKNKKINLLLRMRMKEYTIYTGKYFVFGMSSEKVNEWIPRLRKNNNILDLGVHFHRKTQNTSEWNIKKEIEQKLTKKTLENIDLFNIGGGLPVDYKNSSGRNLNNILEKIIEFKGWLQKDYNVKTIIEPGRFIAAPSTRLETEILSVNDNTIVVDASVYNSSMDTIIVPIKLLIEGELDEGEDYLIKGCTPCSMDVFRYRAKLKNPGVGDKLVFLNAGGYNFTTDFCNLPKLDVEFVD